MLLSIYAERGEVGWLCIKNCTIENKMSGVSGTPNRRLKGGNRPPHMSQSKNLWMPNTRHNTIINYTAMPLRKFIFIKFVNVLSMGWKVHLGRV